MCLVVRHVVDHDFRKDDNSDYDDGCRRVDDDCHHVRRGVCRDYGDWLDDGFCFGKEKQAWLLLLLLLFSQTVN